MENYLIEYYLDYVQEKQSKHSKEVMRKAFGGKKIPWSRKHRDMPDFKHKAKVFNLKRKIKKYGKQAEKAAKNAAKTKDLQVYKPQDSKNKIPGKEVAKAAAGAAIAGGAIAGMAYALKRRKATKHCGNMHNKGTPEYKSCVKDRMSGGK